jgi:hypothetical protein
VANKLKPEVQGDRMKRKPPHRVLLHNLWQALPGQVKGEPFIKPQALAIKEM